MTHRRRWWSQGFLGLLVVYPVLVFTTIAGEVQGVYDDQVAILTRRRHDPAEWCMGLLIAPDSLLTYAHCLEPVDPPVWAYFGNTATGFRGRRGLRDLSDHPRANATNRSDLESDKRTMNPAISTMQLPSSTSSPNEEVKVGDMDDWVRITEAIVHPEYVDAQQTPSLDVAVVRLELARVQTRPFTLAARISNSTTDLNISSGTFIRSFEAFRVRLEPLLGRTTGARKVQALGPYRKVTWGYCERGRAARQLSHHGLVCAVAGAVERRIAEQLNNVFVTLDGQLLALSLGDAASDSHRFVFLSELAAFISQATHRRGIWVQPMTLAGGGKPPTTLQGYVAGLRMETTGTNFCLGSLIAPQFVLTAAHCVQGVDFARVSVGSWFGASDHDGEQIKVERVTIHPRFRASTFENDYAIVKLQYISIQPPITLYNGRRAVAPGTRLTFHGYGPNTSADARKPERWQQQAVELPVVGPMACKAALQPPVLDATMLCAGGEAGKDACQGDSGGPLVISDGAGVALVASASYGRGCGMAGVPAVYALTAQAAEFINDNVLGHRWRFTRPSDEPQGPALASGAQSPPLSESSVSPSRSPMKSSIEDVDERSRQQQLSEEEAENVVREIGRRGNWSGSPAIALDPTERMLLVGHPKAKAFTLDAVASALLLLPLSSHARLPRAAMPYRCTGSIRFYSTRDLGGIERVISTRDGSPLRQRRARFS